MDFHQRFRNQVRSLQEQIDNVASPELTPTERKAKSDASLAAITKLASELADASGDLPSYDQRSYNQALKELQDKLAVTQASHAPKTKFSFKNKRLAGPSSEANSAATSRSATPLHLRDSRTGDNVDEPTPALASPPSHVASPHDQLPDAHERGTPPIAPHARDKPISIIDQSHLSISGSMDIYLKFPTLSQEAEVPQHGLSCIVSEISSSIVQLVHTESVPPVPFLTINNVVGSLIITPDVNGPAHITGLRDSTIVLSCHQFRMHQSHNVDVYLHCSSRPIIEDCSGIRFTSIPGTFSRAGNSHRRNMFDQVDDFKWLRAEPSPNWSLMKEDQRRNDENWTSVLERLGKLEGDPRDAASVRTILEAVGAGSRNHHV